MVKRIIGFTDSSGKMKACLWHRGQILAISDTPQNTDLSHISFSHLPVEFESHCLWGLHPRNESRVGLRMQTLDNAFSLSIFL